MSGTVTSPKHIFKLGSQSPLSCHCFVVFFFISSFLSLHVFILVVVYVRKCWLHFELELVKLFLSYCLQTCDSDVAI